MSRAADPRPGGRDKIETSEWIEHEEKVPDQATNADARLGRARVITVATGKGRRKRGMRLRIPSALVPELKRQFLAAFWDGETLDAPSATASRFPVFAQITQGSSAQQRLGDSIFVEKVVVRLHFEQNTSITFCTAHIAAILDTEPAVGSPAWTDVFQGIGAAGSGAYNVAIPNFDKRSRFVYKERLTVPICPQGGYWNGSTAILLPRPVQVTMEIPIRKRISYDDTASVYKGCELQIFGWSDVTANVPKCWASYETFFTDC
jgi:hypothetical protein